MRDGILDALGIDDPGALRADQSEIDISLSSHIEAAIDAHVGPDEDEQDRHETRIGIYHASAGYGCIRKRWYDAHDVVTSPWHDFPDGIAFRGNLTEDEVEEAMVAELPDQIGMELEVGNEHPMSVEVETQTGSFYITGSTDPYVEDVSGALVEIAEVKSASSLPDEPKPSHEMQLNTYLSGLGVQTGTIVYVNPSTWETRVFCYEQDDGLWEFTKILHAVFHHHMETDTLPPRTPMRDGECRGCPYRGYCVRDDPAREFREEDFPPDWDTDAHNVFKDSD